MVPFDVEGDLIRDRVAGDKEKCVSAVFLADRFSQDIFAGIRRDHGVEDRLILGVANSAGEQWRDIHALSLRLIDRHPGPDKQHQQRQMVQAETSLSDTFYQEQISAQPVHCSEPPGQITLAPVSRSM